MNLKKVLWLPRWYPNKFDPYDGNFVEAHARVAARVADIAVLYVHSDTGLNDAYAIEESTDTEQGFPVIRVYYKKPSFSFAPVNAIVHGLRFRKSQQIGFQRLTQQWGNPDACHVHVLSRPAWLARKLGKPYFITEHASRYFPENLYFTGWLRRWWTRKVVKDAKRVSTVSYALRDAMQSHGLEGSYERISNVVRTDLFTPNPSPPPLPYRLVHISTLLDIPKNTGGILRACALLKERGTEFRLDLIGDGPERAKQEALCRELGIMDWVKFHGNIPLQDVASKLRQAHALVMFSWYETQSIVVLEALASGVPVVATAVGGLAEHLKPAFGAAAEPGDEQSLSQGIQHVLENYDSYDREAMRKYVVELASVDAIAEQFRDLYEG